MFKEAFLEWNFSTLTFFREFPLYAVQPTSQDIEHNTFPIPIQKQ